MAVYLGANNRHTSSSNSFPTPLTSLFCQLFRTSNTQPYAALLFSMLPVEGEDISSQLRTPLQPNDDIWAEPEEQGCPTWEELAVAEQLLMADNFAETFCFSFSKEEFDFARKKIGFAMFGPPDELQSSIGYNQVKSAAIEHIFQVIMAKNEILLFQHKRLYFSFVFVYLKVDCSGVVSTPVFKIPASTEAQDGFSHFIDTDGRVYSIWTSYLSDNKLPSCLICYPHDGEYQVNSSPQDFELAPSNRAELKHKMLNVLDKVGIAGTLGATVVGLATVASLPVSGPLIAASAVVGGAAGVYGAGRSLATLVDRSKHEQSIDLKDRESLASYLTLMGSMTGLASYSLISQIGPLVRHSARIHNLCLLVNGAIIGNNCYNLYKKYKRGDNITALECFQLSAAILFFTNSVVNHKTSESIAKDEHFSEFEHVFKESSSRRNLAGNSPSRGKMQQPKLIRNLSYIDNKDEFFSLLITSTLLMVSKIAGSTIIKQLSPRQVTELNEIRSKINNNDFFKLLVNIATKVNNKDNEVFLEFIKYLYQYMKKFLVEMRTKVKRKGDSSQEIYQQLIDILSNEENIEKIKRSFFDLYPK